MHYAQLKARQREVRDSLPEEVGLRVHRALSWLGRAEQEGDDQDARFVFLWIAFNAAYAKELAERSNFGEKGLFATFIRRLVELDTEKLLYHTVWEEFAGSIRLLIDNRYIFQPFWDHQNGRVTEEEWKEAFDRSRHVAKAALAKMDTARVLVIVFERLYTLRNQLVHGGATWNSQVNRNQVRDGANILYKLVPAIIHIMMESADVAWGKPCYPVVK